MQRHKYEVERALEVPKQAARLRLVAAVGAEAASDPWGDVDVAANTLTRQLASKLAALESASSALQHETPKIEERFASLRQRLLEVSSQNIDRMVIELGTGGNIRLEDGKPSDVWYSSCVDLLKSRFFHRDFLPLGVVGVRINRVTRIHNRFLRNRFDARMADVLATMAYPLEGGGGEGDAGGEERAHPRRALEYLFFTPPRGRDAGPGAAVAEVQRIAEEGFTAAHMTAAAPVPPLPLGYAEPERLTFMGPMRRGRNRNVTMPPDGTLLPPDTEPEETPPTPDAPAAGRDSGMGLPLTSSLSCADMPRLCQAVVAAMEATGEWRRADAPPPSAERPPAPRVDESGPDAWIRRAQLDMENVGTRTVFERLSAAAAAGSAECAHIRGNGFDAPEVCEGVVLITKVFLGRCRPSDAAAAAADAGGDGTDDDGARVVYHSASAQRRDDPKQCRWVAMDPALVLPEYSIEYEYIWAPAASVGGGVGRGGATAAAAAAAREADGEAAGRASTIAAELDALAAVGNPEHAGERAVRLTAAEEVDLRPLVRPLAKFVTQCKATRDALAASGGEDVASRAVGVPPMLPPPLKVPRVTEAALADACGGPNVRDLEYVNLCGCGVRSVEGVAVCAGLRVLLLAFNEIAKLDGVGALRKLERLDAGHNALEGLDALEGLVRLRALDLSSNRLASVDVVRPLKRWLPSLLSLSLAGNPLCRSKAHRAVVVRRLPMLSELDGRAVRDADRRAAAACASRLSARLLMRSVYTGVGDRVFSDADVAGVPEWRGGGASDASEEEGAARVPGALGPEDARWDDCEVLDVSRMLLRDVHGLGRLGGVRRASFADNALVSAVGVEAMAMLEDLSLEENRLTSLAGIGQLKFLRKLELGKNKLQSVRARAGGCVAVGAHAASRRWRAWMASRASRSFPLRTTSSRRCARSRRSRRSWSCTSRTTTCRT